MAFLITLSRRPILFILLLFLAACGGTSATTGTTTPTAATHITPTPTTAPATTLTVPLLHTLTLGASLAVFQAKYGTPTTIGPGDYQFSSTLTVMTVSGPAVSSVIASSGSGFWTATTAKAHCLVYAPPDARYIRHYTITKGGVLTEEVDVYVSPSLARLFAASAFTDESGKVTTPGTLGIGLLYASGSTSQFFSCDAVTAGLDS